MDNLQCSSLERLEARIAPATLLNPRTVTYIDPDGDTVRVTTSKGTWDLTTDFVFVPAGVGEQLQRIDVARKAEFIGAKITVSAQGPGDGFAHVEFVNATGIDLRAVKIDGDLGSIEAGDEIARTKGLGSLTVQSMGRFVGPAEVAFSRITGGLGKLDVADDFIGARLIADSIRSLRIGGDVIGGDDAFSGTINGVYKFGSAFVGGDVVGGVGEFSGQIFSSDGRIDSVRIGGSVLGGSGENSGRIAAALSIRTVRIEGDVRGGSGDDSGNVEGVFGLGSVRVDGDLIGGGGIDSGEISSLSGNIGSVRLGGSIQGGAGLYSGSIFADVRLGLLQTGISSEGSIVGGIGMFSASITAGEIGKMIIDGDLRGSEGRGGGMVFVSDGRLGSLLITGSLIGGDATGATNTSESGYVEAQDIGTITIRGDIIAGSAIGTGSIENSGAIRSNNAIKSLVVGGGIIGNPDNPVIVSAVGAVHPTRTTDLAIGSIQVGGGIARANILAGFDVLDNPVNADAQIGTIRVRDDVQTSNLVAGSEAGSDGFFGTADDVPISGPNDREAVIARIGKIIVGGSVNGSIAGSDAFGFVANQIGALRIDGRPVSLRPGPFNDTTPILIAESTGDVFVQEV